MKATKIYYQELRTVGQFNNKTVGIELEIEDGEKAADVAHKAKMFVQSMLADSSLSPQLLESVVRSVRSAQTAIEDLGRKAQEALPLNDEIPF